MLHSLRVNPNLKQRGYLHFYEPSLCNILMGILKGIKTRRNLMRKKIFEITHCIYKKGNQKALPHIQFIHDNKKKYTSSSRNRYHLKSDHFISWSQCLPRNAYHKIEINYQTK